MDKLNLNKLLNREEQETQVKIILKEFENNQTNLLFKKGIYIYGDTGTGKTMFITNILREMNYDIIRYDAGDIRNTSVIDDITKHNMSDKNIMSMFNKNVKKIAIIMDEIDGMNNGDKGGINSLIKIIRPKKTKRQKTEESTVNPIICIGNYKVDKKIKELMKVCNIIELKTPTIEQTSSITTHLLPDIDNELKTKIVNYSQGDLRKLNNIFNLCKHQTNRFMLDSIDNVLQIKSHNDDTKNITNKLMNQYYNINEHNNIMNDTDRTSVGLLWHENIIDNIEKMHKSKTIPFYIKQLDNICLADYIDRITFQKQIWQFNEMSSLIKTFKNNKLYHDTFSQPIKPHTASDVRFTKVLTKYSTEYNNSLFIQKLCQNLCMDKKDLFGFFVELKSRYDDAEILNLLECCEINKLDINRIYRYIEKYIKEDAIGMQEKDIEEEIEEEFCE